MPNICSLLYFVKRVVYGKRKYFASYAIAQCTLEITLIKILILVFENP